jgi:hypothetical protein
MPKSRTAKESLNTTKRQVDDLPRKDDPFVEGCTWAEFNDFKLTKNSFQVNIDFTKENQIWYYLGKHSTEARAQFTEDPAKPRHNPKGHFLETLPKPAISTMRPSYAASYPAKANQVNHNALNASRTLVRPPQPSNTSVPVSVNPSKLDRPYVYKPRTSGDKYQIDAQAYHSQQNFLNRSAPYSYGTDPRWRPSEPSAAPPLYRNHQNYASPSTSSQASPQTRAPLAPPAPYVRQPQPLTPNSSTSYSPTAYRPPAQQAKQNNTFSSKSYSRPNPFAKYAYLQKEHNRSPLEYKSPYRPGGGFMNGYQGSLEKHLQQTMFKNRLVSGTSKATPSVFNPLTQGHSQRPQISSNQQKAPIPYGPSSNSAHIPANNSTVTTTRKSWEDGNTSGFHPAIRQEYSPLTHDQQLSLQRASQDTVQRPPLDGPLRQIHQIPQPAQVYPRQYHFNQTSPPHPNAPPNNSTRPPQQQTQLPPQPQPVQKSSQMQHAQLNPPKQHQQYPISPQPLPQGINHESPQQQYRHGPQAQSQMTGVSQQKLQSAQDRDLPDVPVDSTSLIENMMMNLKKATSGSALPSERQQMT